MRAREQARNPEPHPERRDDPERRAFEVAGDAQAHHERRAARRKARQDDDAAPPGETEGQREQNLGEPFMRGPGRRFRRPEAEGVHARNRAMRHDPVAGRQMRPRIPVGEDARRNEADRKQADGDQRENKPRRSRERRRGAGGRKGDGLGERHAATLPKAR